MPVTQIDFSKYETAAPPQIDFSKYETAAEPGWLDKEIPLTSHADATQQGLQTIARGARDAVVGVKQLVTHPIDTVKSMAQLPSQAAQVPGAIRDINQGVDPAGTYAKVAQETAGQGAGQAGLALATEGIARAAGPALRTVGKSVSEKMYRSALKPSTTIPAAKSAAMVQTGLKEGIVVGNPGLEKIGSLIDDLNTKIAAEIQADPTRPINKFKVTSRLSDTAKTFRTQVNPAADLQAISESGNEFLANQPGNIAAADAQALKTGTYRQLKGKAYGELKSATIEAQKALARGIKEELNTAFPELKSLNARESQFFALEPAIAKAVQRVGNHQLIGVGTPAAAGAGALLTGTAKGGAISGILKAIIDDPMVKSRLAIALNKASRGKLSVGASNARVASYLTALSAGGASSNGDVPSQ